jgi:uncharacterized spore protein YtfJ
MNARDMIKGVREALSARQVYGEPIEREGVTLLPAVTIMGGGGAGGGEGPAKEGETGPNAGYGSGFGGVMWPAGAFEIKDGQVTWRPAIDLTRILLMALALAITVVRVYGRRKR